MSDASAPEPLRNTVAGVELVTIPVTHYAELLDCQRRLAMVRASSERFAADPRSRIDRDPEVAFFLAECFGRMLLKDTYAACRERFGEARTPGRSSIDRYWNRLRQR